MTHRLKTENLRNFLRTACRIDGTLHIEKFKVGQSNPTYYLKVGQQELVLRKKPEGKLLPGAHQINREYRVMKALNSVNFPVPKMVTYCSDVDVLGTEFYIMDYQKGRIHTDTLPGNTDTDCRESVFSAVETLAKLHSVEPLNIGLADYGKLTGYCQRQIRTWSKQYHASKHSTISEMDKLESWLHDNVPAEPAVTSIVHGDYTLPNIMFHLFKNKVQCILDWELSTLGHPLSDLAHFCMSLYHLPKKEFSFMFGMFDMNTVMKEEEVVQYYCDQRNISFPPPSWEFFQALNLFKAAAIAQGVYARYLQGNSSQKSAEVFGNLVQPLAKSGLDIVATTKSRHRADDLVLSPSVKGRRMLEKVKKFIDEFIIPNEAVYYDFLSKADNKWCVVPIVEELKLKAKAEGLWNLFLPGVSGLSNVDYAYIAEELGKYVFASEVMNCSAPDTGNMEVLHLYGDEYQKQTFLEPLLDGSVRSAFCMTEPAVASSDATNMQLSITLDGDHYIVDGRKWWSSGAGDPRCKFGIVMGRCGGYDKKPRHQQHSMILVPFDLAGVKVIRPMHVFGYEDYPHGHMEVVFENVRVPKKNLILGEGRGFEIAQGRLGPGRIHHCMRSIGAAERCLEMFVSRGSQRRSFGKCLIDHQVNQHHLAQSRIEIEQARLLVLQTALMIDLNGAKAARKHISMIKVSAVRVFKNVVDRTIQIHGAAGVSQDFPLAAMYSWARALQFADGPDEVHLDNVAKLEIRDQLIKAKL